MAGGFGRGKALFVWWVLAGIALVALAVAIALSLARHGAAPLHAGGDVLAWVVFAGAAICVAVSRIVPARTRIAPGVPPEQVAQVRLLLAGVFCFAAAFWAAFAWGLSGRAPALVAWAISIVGLVAAYPSLRRWEARLRTAEVEVARTTASAPPPLPRRTAIGYLAAVGVPTAVALALVFVAIWGVAAHGRPPAWVPRALSTVLGVEMVASAWASWFLRAPRSARPRWRRAVAVVSLACAAPLLLFAARGH